MSFSSNRRILTGTLETVPGTPEFTLDSTFPADADFNNRITNIEMSMDVGFDEEVGNVMTGDHGELESYSTLRQGEISFEIMCDWGGAVNTDPEWEKFVQACGWKVNAYGAVGIGFQPLAAYDCISMTIVVYDIECGTNPDATGYLFKGCMGNVELGADGVGGKWKFKFTFKGAFVDAYDIDPSGAEYPELTGASTRIAEKLLSNTVTVQGVSQLISSFNINAGNDIKMVPDQGDSTGIKQFYISNRKPRLAMNAIMNDHTTEDVWDNVINETTGIINVTSTNLTIHCPRTQYLNPGMSDMEGLVGYEHSFKLLRNHNGSAAITATIPDEICFELLQGARS